MNRSWRRAAGTHGIDDYGEIAVGPIIEQTTRLAVRFDHIDGVAEPATGGFADRPADAVVLAPRVTYPDEDDW
jgi:hypothetical protein